MRSRLRRVDWRFWFIALMIAVVMLLGMWGIAVWVSQSSPPLFDSKDAATAIQASQNEYATYMENVRQRPTITYAPEEK